MKNPIFLILLLLVIGCTSEVTDTEEAFPTRFETSQGKETATYEEVIEFYIRLAREYPEINVQTLGTTDSGLPLHLVTYNPDSEFNFAKIRDQKYILLVNNGIHPGESDGIDATMLLMRDLASGKISAPQNLVITAIPVYNVGGALNRNSNSRANQNGPEAYGFRGNARNFDLNRDFIKMDTENARTFAEIFHLVAPDFFLDNHVSNGADYQYTLTHLFTQADRLGGAQGKLLRDSIQPAFEASLAAADWEITPYVNVFNRPPEGGFSQFMDHPRYSTGYTALWQVPGMMIETHMLKPYAQRVKGTYQAMISLMELSSSYGKQIRENKRQDLENWIPGKAFPVRWELGDQIDSLDFLGFQADTLISQITGLDRLKYDRDRPFRKKVAYKNRFIPADSVIIPQAYIIPKSWTRTLDRLQTNKIVFERLEADTTLYVEAYQILSFDTYTRPYEGHYPHYNTHVKKTGMNVQLREGDLWVPAAQPGIKYLLEVLEPQGNDSFFSWNFFDTRLQQKEGFSPYVFEDLALEILKANDSLSEAFQLLKLQDTSFAKNSYGQLRWIYNHSKYRERDYMLYPIYRIPAIVP